MQKITRDNIQDYALKLMFKMKEEEFPSFEKEFETILKHMDLITKIEVIEKGEIKNFIKEKLITILREIGYQVEVEIKLEQDIPTYRIYSNNDSLLIGKGGKNLEALQIVLRQIVNIETGINYKFFLELTLHSMCNCRFKV